MSSRAHPRAVSGRRSLFGLKSRDVCHGHWHAAVTAACVCCAPVAGRGAHRGRDEHHAALYLRRHRGARVRTCECARASAHVRTHRGQAKLRNLPRTQLLTLSSAHPLRCRGCYSPCGTVPFSQKQPPCLNVRAPSPLRFLRAFPRGEWAARVARAHRGPLSWRAGVAYSSCLCAPGAEPPAARRPRPRPLPPPWPSRHGRQRGGASPKHRWESPAHVHRNWLHPACMRRGKASRIAQ